MKRVIYFNKDYYISDDNSNISSYTNISHSLSKLIWNSKNSLSELDTEKRNKLFYSNFNNRINNKPSNKVKLKMMSL